MGMRRLARERAIQFLFQFDLNPVEDLELALKQFWQAQENCEDSEATSASTGSAPQSAAAVAQEPTVENAALRLFCDGLIRGTLEHREELDVQIKKHAQNWDIGR